MKRNTHLKKISFLVIKLKQIFNIKINVNIFLNKVTQKNYNLIIQNVSKYYYSIKNTVSLFPT